ncbi:putative FtsJ-like methyltransferase [Cotonvirus japonicus]|uniref:FtsJ-like methyltransferase n=1 Tax=Cotonvirus japonicus TaxID=2811091 RepID=A0ABM7NSM7_9VIRU|nr:putative FtsJ-like methyltransferase [Cotonvirus japonicus]BCS83172.1 putative FtsJ-like methyltransferase [Cotonvirus japonicus]
MKPIIYSLPRTTEILPIDVSEIIFDTNPSPQLIKYGFNNTSDKLNIVSITNSPHYKVGLKFDFQRQDENSFVMKTEKIFNHKINETFCEIWEIFNIFNLLGKNTSIFTNKSAEINNIIDNYIDFFDSNNKYDVLDDPSNIKSPINLIFMKYSNINLDENALIQLIYNDLPMFFNVQDKDSNMVLQLFNIQTQITVELIQYLTSLYTESYLIKPLISSDLFDGKYLVLLGLKNPLKLKLPNNSNDSYLLTLGFKNISEDLILSIQCMNANILPAKYELYDKIKSFLDLKVYEGATYQEFIQQQNDSTNKWIEIYTDIDKIKTILKNNIEETDKICGSDSQLINYYK